MKKKKSSGGLGVIGGFTLWWVWQMHKNKSGPAAAGVSQGVFLRGVCLREKCLWWVRQRHQKQKSGRSTLKCDLIQTDSTTELHILPPYLYRRAEA